jgi:hypothetical protein
MNFERRHGFRIQVEREWGRRFSRVGGLGFRFFLRLGGFSRLPLDQPADPLRLEA